MSEERWTIEDKEGIAGAIRRMGEEDLRYLNRLIVERLNLIAQAHSTRLMAGFSVGDRVSFQSRVGRKTGVILRLNKKTASVRADDGHDWNVSPGLLERLSGGGGA